MSDKSNLSIKKEKIIHGVTIKKLPIGRYLSAINIMQEFPTDLIKKCFPDVNIKEINIDNLLDNFSNLLDDESKIIELLQKLFTVIPEYALQFIAQLIDSDYEYLYNNVTPDELVETLIGFYEINKFDNIKKLTNLVSKKK